MVEFLMIVRLLCLAKHCGRKLIENYSRVLWSKDHRTFLCKTGWIVDLEDLEGPGMTWNLKWTLKDLE